MKKNPVLLSITIVFILAGCVSQSQLDDSQKIIASLQQQVDSLVNVGISNQNTIRILRDSVMILSYPANQRLAKASRLVEEGRFEEARNEISSLRRIFPESSEAGKCEALLKTIEAKEAKAKAEAERLKAMGFKVFPDKTSVQDDGVTYSFSGFSFGRTYTSDYCADVGEYSYRTADKNNTYILTTVSVTTKKNYASAPSLYACLIVDGKLKSIGYFMHEYASWSSYGAKIGNYDDDSHDFSKVNTVRYKMGNEISAEQAKLPIVILMPKGNNRFEDDTDVEYAKEHYIVVKIINRNKL